MSDFFKTLLPAAILYLADKKSLLNSYIQQHVRHQVEYMNNFFKTLLPAAIFYLADKRISAQLLYTVAENMKQTIFNRQGTEVGYNEGYSSTFK
jgi:hypothetical protein